MTSSQRPAPRSVRSTSLSRSSRRSLRRLNLGPALMLSAIDLVGNGLGRWKTMPTPRRMATGSASAAVDVVAVQQHLAHARERHQLVHPVEAPDEGRLAAAGRADERGHGVPGKVRLTPSMAWCLPKNALSPRSASGAPGPGHGARAGRRGGRRLLGACGGRELSGVIGPPCGRARDQAGDDVEEQDDHTRTSAAPQASSSDAGVWTLIVLAKISCGIAAIGSSRPSRRTGCPAT